MAHNAEQRVNAMGDRLHGFSLRDVCWGYRDIFARTIEQLFADGVLGEERAETSRQFFDLLKQADQSCFDHVLKEFISAINPRTRWILDLPGIFAEVVTLGRELAEARLHDGVAFFRTWGEGGLGDTPREVRAFVSRFTRLRALDPDLAMAFLRGYGVLRTRLRDRELDRFLDAGVRMRQHNPQQACAFLRNETRSAETVIRSITRECRLDDVQRELSALLRALVGYAVDVDHLGRLDSDDLIERGSSVVCLYKWLYLPAAVRHFDAVERNRAWYLLAAVVAAGMLAENSFPRVHGHPRYRTCADLAGRDPARQTLLQVVEHVRVLDAVRARWPGAAGLLDLGIETEFTARPSAGAADGLLRACLAPAPSASAPAVNAIRAVADRAVNVFDTAALLDDTAVARLCALCPGLAAAPLRPLSFAPDFLFPGRTETPPPDALIADLSRTAERRRNGDAAPADAAARTASDTPPDGADGTPGEDAQAPVPAVFVYDEWSHADNAYYRDHCLLHERVMEPAAHVARPDGIGDAVRHVRQAFERLKPELAQKEKRLREGDTINPDRLLDFVVSTRHEPSPRVDFYERPLTTRRDLAVLVLLDVSGSTGGAEGAERIIEIEKRTALVFGEGLSALGDAFALCGFSSNGRENCTFAIYKAFESPWDRRAVDTLLSAVPANATRIGPALRHSGMLLARRENRQRLILLITDGKPMDTGYDPKTRYAQYDVRKACEENLRRGIQTFAISTEENTRADMDIMFPHGRFVILPGMRRLPAVLPKLYLKLTT
jgi:nitric oxide reductase activation protein